MKRMIYTKWHWRDGLASSEEIQNGMKENLQGKTDAIDVIWWKMDDNHHQSITIYSSEDAAKKHRAELEQFRKNSSNEYSIKMIDETMGPVVAQLSEL